MNRLTPLQDWLLTSILGLSLAPLAQAQGLGAHKTVKLERGQTLSLQLTTPLSSATAKVGDDVPLQLVHPLTVNGGIVLATGWKVRGRISKVKRAGTCKSGGVRWKLDFIDTPNGERVKVKNIESYYVKYSSAGGVPDRVPLGTPLTAIGHEAKFAGGVAIFIAFSPFTVPLAMGLARDNQDDRHDRCRTEPGAEDFTAAGTRYLYAVSEGRRVTSSDPQRLFKSEISSTVR